ncbi:MAG: S8 family serine peptidase [Bacteroidales bacterium]|nr:S8 family serine peptidase [Bacteroidales bacterium]
MRIQILFSLLAASTLFLHGENASVSPGVRYLMSPYQSSAAPHHAPATDQRSDDRTEYLPLLVRVENETSPLPDFATELHRRGSIVICTVPADRLTELASAMGVRRLEAHAASIPQMADARMFCNLPEITDISVSDNTPYDGTGTVVGFTDVGFDPNHINFLEEDGTPRVKKLVNYTTDSPRPTILTSPDDIRRWTTDDDGESHATHVAGILAGSSSTSNMRGMAPGAEIVATTSPLYDAMMLAGCEEIIAYAKSAGKPATINISVSSDIGPHDGTTLFNRYMESLTEDATVCISAGNEAKRSGFASGTTSAQVPGVRTYFREYPNLMPLYLHGTVDIWSDTPEPFDVNILTQNFSTGEINRIPVPFDMAAGQFEWLLCSDNVNPGDIPVIQMPEYIDGYIHIVAELNPENNRFNVALNCNYTDISTDDPDKANVLFGVEAIPPSPGTVVELYSTPKIFFTRHHDRAEGSLVPTSARAVNDFCSGDGPICVGALNSANSFTGINGQPIDFQAKLPPDDVSYFSSYGTLSDGKILPDICAPGAQLVSSLSWPYCDSNPDYPQKLATIAIERDGRTDYWGPMQGTSMSSPFVAGVTALWLQANPELTGKEIREIVLNTASVPTVNTENPQWGHGILDAAAGLKIARSLAGSGSVSVTENDKPLIKLSGQMLTVALAKSAISEVRIISTDGRTVYSHSGNGEDQINIDCSSFHSGIYILDIYGGSGTRVCTKIAIN